jgi:hypothetical protein
LDALCDAHLKDILQTGTDGWLTPVILATQEAKIQEDFCSKLALGKEFSRPHLKKTNHKQNKRLVEWLKGVGPEFKPQFHKKRYVTTGAGVVARPPDPQ